jgi:hypothetical protein
LETQRGRSKCVPEGDGEGDGEGGGDGEGDGEEVGDGEAPINGERHEIPRSKR